MSEKSLEIAEAYYAALNNKDIAGMREHLHPDVKFVGPMAELSGKDAVLDAAERLFFFFKSLQVRAKFSSENKVMLAYDLDCPFPIGCFRIAALLTIENKLITAMELFYDARLFDSVKDSFFAAK